MKTRWMIAMPFVVVLGACSTYMTPRYAVKADTSVSLKSIGATNIGVGPFSVPSRFDNTCRGVGPLALPDGMTHAEYIRKAFEDELKAAGSYAATKPRVVISGNVTRLEFSSISGLTAGSWTIDLTLSSSNGQRMLASESNEFAAGLDSGCKQTAERFMPTVQNLIKTMVNLPEFKALVQ